MSRRIFVDMDGVLAKWEDASLEEMTSPGFFLSRVPDPNVCDMFSMLQEKAKDGKIEVFILSSYLLPMSMEEKIEWNKRHTHIPEENQIYVPYGESKAAALESIGGIRKTDVLIDDFTDILKGWPGIAIKLYNGINGTHGTWNGYSIRNNMDAEKMFLQLDAISLMESTRIEHMERESAMKRGNLRR